ncbi:MAG: hypothetical protein ACK5P5_13315 [Pseudobdellovibrionaceae bacterium]
MTNLQWLRSRSRVVSFFLASGIALSLLFQNCGKAGFESVQEETNLELNAPSAATQDKGANGFAFDARLDQITYMSCPNPQSATPANGYFLFKAGAYAPWNFNGVSYGGGGMRMNQTFYGWAMSTLKPIYPSSTVTHQQVRKFISEDGRTQGAQLQFGILDREYINVPPFQGYQAGTHIVDVTGSLTDERWSYGLLPDSGFTAGTFSRFFPLAPLDSGSIIETQINAGGPLNAENIRLLTTKDNQSRANLEGTGMISLTYKSLSGEGWKPRMPSSTQAYGKGYQFSFSAAGSGTYHKSKIMTKVREYKTLTNVASYDENIWSCDFNASGNTFARTFKVIERAHFIANPNLCPPENLASVMNDAVLRHEWMVVRRHLDPNFWDINVNQGCAVPKKGACGVNEALGFDSTAQKSPLTEYNENLDCFEDGSSYTGLKRCAQFISICIRQNQE